MANLLSHPHRITSLDPRPILKSEYLDIFRPLTLHGRYRGREGRSAFIVHNFGHRLKGSALDVGGDRGLLSETVWGRYVTIDLRKGADIQHDLDSGPVPCENESFDTVICTDVLEHLDNIHGVFQELLRVAKKTVIVSLPNSYRLLPGLFRRPDRGTKFYGLPVEPEGDRHRHFFSSVEGVNFLLHQARKAGAIEARVALYSGLPLWKQLLLRVPYPQETRWLAVVSATIWGEIIKTEHFDDRFVNS